MMLGKTQPPLTLWTIGHSTHSLDQLIAMLQAHGIQRLVDVRHFPGSRRFPHFNKPALAASLEHAGLGYEHLLELGGRRPARADSHNLAWRNASFRGYADYMETPAFLDGIARLRTLAGSAPTAIMCSEAVWWRCHRSMIADFLKAEGAKILHILSEHKVEEHPYSAAARLVEGRLSYAGTDFFGAE